MMQSIDTPPLEEEKEEEHYQTDDDQMNINIDDTIIASNTNNDGIHKRNTDSKTPISTTTSPVSKNDENDDDDCQDRLHSNNSSKSGGRIRRWETKNQKYSMLEDNFSPEFSSDHPKRRRKRRIGRIRRKKKKKKEAVVVLSEGDMTIFEQLDADYMRAIEERDIGWTARQESVRQNAGFSCIFMIVYLVSGSIYFQISASDSELTMGENLLFSIMSITTVGYSSMTIDTTQPSFQLFMILYLLIGIATLTIMVAQVYQYIILETERARSHHHDRNIAQTSSPTNTTTTTTTNNNNNTNNNSSNTAAAHTNHHDLEAYHLHHHNDISSTTKQGVSVVGEWIVHKAYPMILHFLRYNEVGQVLVVLSPFLGLTLIGAVFVGTMEGWTFVESFYFAIVSLTTVGYGDYYPTKQGSIWFCVFWLPFSVGFMSFYLGLVGYWYLQLSSRNVKRVLQRKRKYFQRLKRRRQNELQEARTRALAAANLLQQEDNNTNTPTTNTNDNNDHPNNLIYDTSIQNTSSKQGNRKSEAEEIEERGERRRQRIQQNSFHCGYVNDECEDVIQSMRDLIEAVRYNSNNNTTAHHFNQTNTMEELEETRKSHTASSSLDSKKVAANSGSSSGGNVSFLSLKAVDKIEMGKETRKKPTFALRVLVQERLADIIAVDIAGYQNHVDMKDTTLSITMNQLNYAAEKWHIPQTAWNDFRAVSFEVLYFIGEHALITRGSDALFDLTPHEFHKLFAPLIASMGDFDTMNRWYSITEVLSDADLRRSSRYSLLDDPPQSYSNLHNLNDENDDYDDDDDDDDDDPFNSHTIT